MSEVEPDIAPRLAVRSNAPARQLRIAVVGEVAMRLANVVIEACADRGITLMPLKGALLLSRWPQLLGKRDLVDVDFLARSSDFDGVANVLGRLGFEANIRSTAGSTFASDSWPLSIDLHRKLFPHGLFAMTAEGVFSRAQVDASLFLAPVARMSDEDLFAHLIGHFVKGRGHFDDATSLVDFRWLCRRGLWQDPISIGRHLRALGLQRAAGFVLGHPSLRGEASVDPVLCSLDLSPVDRATIDIARFGTDANRGVPPRWVPHLLDRSLAAGSRSFLAHLDEATRRLRGHVSAGLESKWRMRSATPGRP